MSAGDMFLALGANDFFDRLANGSKEEQEKRKNEAMQRAMREEWEAQREIEASERDELAMEVRSYEEALNDPMWLGYMIKNDLAGYLRALSKAKTTFRGINPKDPFCGMRGYDGGVNPDFVAVVEDFYLEIRRNIKKYDYQLAKYNFLRDVLIERFEGDESVYTEEESKSGLGISRNEVFSELRANNLFWALSKQNGNWYILDMNGYTKSILEDKAQLNIAHFPIEGVA